MASSPTYWNLVLEDLKKQVSLSQFKTWFAGLKFISTTTAGRKIILSAPSRFSKEHIETKFKKQLQTSINKYYPQVIHIEFQIEKKEVEEENPIQQTLDSSIVETTKIKSKSETLIVPENQLPKKNIHNLNPKYSFDTFVATSNNELAVSVAKTIAARPGQVYNPVFIHSNVGLGKTHLLQAIGHKVLEEFPSYNIRYTTCETFLNQYIAAMHKNQMNEFRDYYRSVDLLLVDDIQFISGKNSTQEAFFHTFNELHQMNKQIVIASDKAPKSLAGVEDRLISRFEWGMVVDISQPTLEDRSSIIKDKAERSRLPLSSDQILSIARSVNTNIRDMEGVLNQIQARIQLLPGKIFTDNDLRKVLATFDNPQVINFSQVNSSTDQVIELVGRIWKVSTADIIGKGRDKNLSLARHIIMYLFHKKLNYSLPVIGRLLGGRDHTTVLHGCNKINNAIKDGDAQIITQVEQVLELLQQRVVA